MRRDVKKGNEGRRMDCCSSVSDTYLTSLCEALPRRRERGGWEGLRGRRMDCRSSNQQSLLCAHNAVCSSVRQPPERGGWESLRVGGRWIANR